MNANANVHVRIRLILRAHGSVTRVHRLARCTFLAEASFLFQNKAGDASERAFSARTGYDTL